MKKWIFIILQCTWGMAQTLLGACFFLVLLRCPHRMYRSCIDTRWNLPSGLSLGMFIFTPNEDSRYTQQLRVHEYGHCIQSMVLGPLYLLVCLISVTWARLPRFVRLRRENGIPYTACFVEAWASKWGELVTGDAAFWN